MPKYIFKIRLKYICINISYIYFKVKYIREQDVVLLDGACLPSLWHTLLSLLSPRVTFSCSFSLSDSVKSTRERRSTVYAMFYDRIKPTA